MPDKKIIHKMGVLSVAKIYAIIMAIVGFIIGIFYAILGAVTVSSGAPPDVFAGLGVIAIIVVPIIYGIMGFVLGALSAWLYNLLSKWIGGIEIELK